MAAARPVVATDLKRDPMARGRNGQADTSSATARALEREAREDVRGGRGVEWRAESGHQARSDPSPTKETRQRCQKIVYTSRFVRVILAQGPCQSSLYRSNF